MTNILLSLSLFAAFVRLFPWRQLMTMEMKTAERNAPYATYSTAADATTATTASIATATATTVVTTTATATEECATTTTDGATVSSLHQLLLLNKETKAVAWLALHHSETAQSRCRTIIACRFDRRLTAN